MFVKCNCKTCRTEREAMMADRLQRLFGEDVPPVSIGQGEYRQNITPRRSMWSGFDIILGLVCFAATAAFLLALRGN